MTHTYSSIDDVLLSQGQPQPSPVVYEDSSQDNSSGAPEDKNVDFLGTLETKENEYTEAEAAEEPSENAPEPVEVDAKDDYGNEVAKPKTYTEEEARELINRAMRERLARMERNNPEKAEAFKRAAQDFEQDTASDEPWEQQLESHIERTLEKISQKTLRARQEAIERQEQAEFEEKFHASRARYNDFDDVVIKAPITDDMVKASRAFKDPAAFFYAAAKTQMAELERIARIPDAYKQVAEIGRLEERMRRSKSATAAPKPVSHHKGDMQIDLAQKKRAEPSIEELIHQAANKKLSQIQARKPR